LRAFLFWLGADFVEEIEKKNKQQLIAACPDKTGTGTHLYLAAIHSLFISLVLSTTPGTMLASPQFQPGMD